MLCPRCDYQGRIIKARIKKLNKEIYICDECDAAWFSKDEIKVENFIDYSTYLEKYGLKGTWENLDYMRCPRQTYKRKKHYGKIIEGVIKKLNKKIFFCDGCEAMWFSKEDISSDSFVNSKEYMREHGLNGKWWEEVYVEGE